MQSQLSLMHVWVCARVFVHWRAGTINTTPRWDLAFRTTRSSCVDRCRVLSSTLCDFGHGVR